LSVNAEPLAKRRDTEDEKEARMEHSENTLELVQWVQQHLGEAQMEVWFAGGWAEDCEDRVRRDSIEILMCCIQPLILCL
jgi:hypothetical protein